MAYRPPPITPERLAEDIRQHIGDDGRYYVSYPVLSEIFPVRGDPYFFDVVAIMKLALNVGCAFGLLADERQGVFVRL